MFLRQKILWSRIPDVVNSFVQCNGTTSHEAPVLLLYNTLSFMRDFIRNCLVSEKVDTRDREKILEIDLHVKRGVFWNPEGSPLNTVDYILSKNWSVLIRFDEWIIMITIPTSIVVGRILHVVSTPYRNILKYSGRAPMIHRPTIELIWRSNNCIPSGLK